MKIVKRYNEFINESILDDLKKMGFVPGKEEITPENIQQKLPVGSQFKKVGNHAQLLTIKAYDDKGNMFVTSHLDNNRKEYQWTIENFLQNLYHPEGGPGFNALTGQYYELVDGKVPSYEETKAEFPIGTKLVNPDGYTPFTQRDEKDNKSAYVEVEDWTDNKVSLSYFDDKGEKIGAYSYSCPYYRPYEFIEKGWKKQQ
jgi:hypothetical protein